MAGGNRDAADQQYPAVAVITNQPASTPGKYGVPFGTEGPFAESHRPQWASRGPSQGRRSGGAGSALPWLPAVDASRQQRVAYFSKHKLRFSLAFQGLCSRPGCSFNQDTSLMSAGYFNAHAGRKRRAPDHREGGREVTRPKCRLYGLCEEHANVVAAVCDKDVESVDA